MNVGDRKNHFLSQQAMNSFTRILLAPHSVQWDKSQALILKEWLEFREETILCYLNEEDKKHGLFIDEISEKILKNVPKQNKKYVEKQLNELDKNFMDYLGYWNEKYYRNGFVDGIELIRGCGHI